MPARGLELLALVRDLPEESRILDRQDGLGRERLEEIHDLRGKASRLLSPNHEHAHDSLLEEERSSQQRPIPSSLEDGSDPPHVIRPLSQNVGKLHWGPKGRRLSGHALPQAERRRPKHLVQLLVEMMRAADVVQFLSRLIVLVDDPAVGRGELHGPRHNSVEHGLQIQSRANRLADLPQCLQLFDQSRQLARAGLELLEEADVLDGDHRLIGEGCQPARYSVWVNGSAVVFKIVITPTRTSPLSMGTASAVR